MALAQGASAVVIAGGVGLRLADYLPRSGFRDRFIAKGRFERRMDEMPVKLITHPRYNQLQKDVERWLRRMPKGELAIALGHKAEEAIKGAVTEAALQPNPSTMDADGRGGFGSTTAPTYTDPAAFLQILVSEASRTSSAASMHARAE